MERHFNLPVSSFTCTFVNSAGRHQLFKYHWATRRYPMSVKDILIALITLTFSPRHPMPVYSIHNMAARGSNPCNFDPWTLELTNQTIVAHDLKADFFFKEIFLDMLPHLQGMKDDCAEWMASSKGSMPFLDVPASERCLARTSLSCYPHPCPNRTMGTR